MEMEEAHLMTALRMGGGRKGIGEIIILERDNKLVGKKGTEEIITLIRLTLAVGKKGTEETIILVLVLEGSQLS
ncbi:hypothetical protein HED22_06620 [Thalassospira sp. HF15]|uniref:hypothetical protein n=1 Tax=Thalassospira sp. HF15 TaxID=2722755 RepID=UPI0014300D82|nr:hypothetical protein [Thalassospira sp. HF15]NIY75312.1 hypothetical protein [Thalassospira sp. HF15]